MGTRIYVLYRLKDGVSRDQYIDWSLSTDQKITPGLEAIMRFRVRQVIETIEGPENQFDIIEEIDVTSVEDWQRGLESEHMRKVQEEWPHYADTTSAVIVAAEPIGSE